MLFALGFTSCFKVETGDSENQDSKSGHENGSSTKSEYKRIRDEVVSLKKVKRSLEEQIEKIEGDEEEHGGLAAKEIKVAEELDQVRAYRDAVDSHEASLDQSLEQWRDATRSSFAGVRLPGIETIKGDQYTDIVIGRVDGDTLTFEHSAGEATIPILELPLGLRKNVIHEPTVLADRAAN
ncbi:MAG: hypothetical protein P1U86_03065 [Verrucomicrobiales bacterium]|nr:hypothetical protein [Verrucomicrobiales bacterium]